MLRSLTTSCRSRCRDRRHPVQYWTRWFGVERRQQAMCPKWRQTSQRRPHSPVSQLQHAASTSYPNPYRRRRHQCHQHTKSGDHPRRAWTHWRRASSRSSRECYCQLAGVGPQSTRFSEDVHPYACDGDECRSSIDCDEVPELCAPAGTRELLGFSPRRIDGKRIGRPGVIDGDLDARPSVSCSHRTLQHHSVGVGDPKTRVGRGHVSRLTFDIDGGPRSRRCCSVERDLERQMARSGWLLPNAKRLFDTTGGGVKGFGQDRCPETRRLCASSYRICDLLDFRTFPPSGRETHCEVRRSSGKLGTVVGVLSSQRRPDCELHLTFNRLAE